MKHYLLSRSRLAAMQNLWAITPLRILAYSEFWTVYHALQRTARYYHHKRNYNRWQGAPDWKPTRVFNISGGI